MSEERPELGPGKLVAFQVAEDDVVQPRSAVEPVDGVQGVANDFDVEEGPGGLGSHCTSHDAVRHPDAVDTECAAQGCAASQSVTPAYLGAMDTGSPVFTFNPQHAPLSVY